MNLPDTTDNDCTNAWPFAPLLELMSNSDDQGAGKQPAGVQFLSKMEGLGGAILFALAGSLTGAAVTVPLLGGTLNGLAGIVVAALYGLATLLVMGRYGLLAGKPWARKLAVVLAITCISCGVAILFRMFVSKFSRRLAGGRVQIIVIVVSLIIAVSGGVVLWYLYRPHVKQYFRTYQYSGQRVERDMWSWRFFVSVLDEIRTTLDERSPASCNTLGCDTLNGLRAILDKIL